MTHAREQVQQDERARREIVGGIDRSMLVEAAAGTGKTRLIIDRMLHGLRMWGIREGGFRLSRAVAITFTEKAAAELESRLRSALARSLYSHDLPEKERENVRRALDEIDRANISTIHAFCASLLREKPAEAGVDPEFEMLDQTQSRLLVDDCWERWIGTQMAECPPPLVEALRAGLGAGAGPTQQAGLRELADSLLASREVLEEGRFRMGRPPATVGDFVLGFRKLCAEVRLFLQENLKTNGNKDFWNVSRFLETVEQIDPHEDAQIRREAHAFLSLNSAKALTSLEMGARNHAAELLEQIGGAASGIGAHLACDLLQWLSAFAAYYEREKRRRSVLDFADLLLLSARMLSEKREIREYFKARFDAFFVDEFQDTDPLQAEMIAFLCETKGGRSAERMEDVRLEEGKLFVVGDPKQSIYRFRRADVQVYEQFKGLFRRLSPDGRNMLTIRQSFRATAPLMDTFNKMFSVLLQPSEVEGVYQAMHVELVPPTGENVPGPSGPAVMAICPPPSLQEDMGTLEKARREEARHIALAIKRVVDGGPPLPAGAWPAGIGLTYGSFACLFRALTDVGIYEDALEEHGVPYRVIGGSQFYRREEIGETISLLRAVDDPLDGLSVAAALRSSYFGVSDEELFRFKECGGRWNYLESEVAEGPAAEAMSVLTQWHTRRNEIPPQVLMREMLDRTKALEAFLLKPDGERRVANLQKLIRELRALWHGSHGTFRDTAEYLASLQEREEAEEESPVVEPGDDFVQLMSIHKSKGLQFEAVVVPDLARRFAGKERNGLLLDRAKARMELRLSSGIRSSGYDEFEELEYLNSLAEGRRLLYVACTRASRCLIVPLYWHGKKRNADCALSLLVETGLFSAPDEVPFGQGRTGVYYLDTRGLAAQPPRTVEDAEREVAPEGASAEVLLDGRREWLASRRGLVERAATSVPILLPSSFETWQAAQRATDGESTGMADMRFGSLFHNVMLRAPLHDAGGDDCELLHKIAAMEAALLGLGGPEAQEAARLAAESLQHDRFREFLSEAQAIDREAEFCVPLKNLPGFGEGQEGYLEGSIDLLVTHRTGTSIIDYKTDRVDEKVLDAAAQGYWPQLTLYSLAAQSCGYAKGEIEMALYFVRCGAFCVRGLDANAVAETLQRVQREM